MLKKSVMLMILVVLAVAAAAGAGWGAAIPTAINVQGKVSVSGAAPGSQNTTIILKLYSGNTAITAQQSYNLSTGNKNYDPATGIFNVVFNPLYLASSGVYPNLNDNDTLPFDAPYTMSITLMPGPDTPFANQALTAAPYAITAQNVYGGMVSADASNADGYNYPTIRAYDHAPKSAGNGILSSAISAFSDNGRALQLYAYGNYEGAAISQTGTGLGLYLSANGGEGLACYSAKSIGAYVGTQSLTFPALEVGGSLEIDGAGHGIIFPDKTVLTSAAGLGGGQWKAGTNANDITNTNTGNVGIGTTNPSMALDVQMNTAGNNGLQLTNLNTSGNALTYYKVGLSQMQVGFITGSLAGSSMTQFGYIRSTGNLVLTTGSNNASMTLLTNGNVGIGRTSPASCRSDSECLRAILKPFLTRLGT